MHLQCTVYIQTCHDILILVEYLLRHHLNWSMVRQHNTRPALNTLHDEQCQYQLLQLLVKQCALQLWHIEVNTQYNHAHI